MSTSWEVNNGTIASVNSSFAERRSHRERHPANEDNAIANNTLKSSNYGMKVFRGKKMFQHTVCTHDRAESMDISGKFGQRCKH